MRKLVLVLSIMAPLAAGAEDMARSPDNDRPVCVRATGDRAPITFDLPANTVSVTLEDQDGSPLPVWQLTPFGDIPGLISIEGVDGHSTLNLTPAAAPTRLQTELANGPADQGQAANYRLVVETVGGNRIDGPLLTVSRDADACARPITLPQSE
jgi:hypothetical protein